jgi:hypothetical protein
MSLATSNASRAQATPHVANADAHRLTQIRRWTATATRNLPHDSKLELSGFSLEGGELSAYFAHDTLRKVDALDYRETGRTREEHYFGDDGGMLSMILTYERYDRPMSGKVVSSYRTSLFFDGERLIQ